jgi:hypothetical protein
MPGDGIELESEEFNAACQVFADQPRFAYDVLHPRMMRFLLDREPQSVRIDGTVLVAWRDAPVSRPGFDAMTGFARDFYQHLPSFLFSDGYDRPGRNTLRIGELDEAALGEPAVDVPRPLRALGYAGRYVELEVTPRRNPDGRSLGQEVAGCVVVAAGWPPFELVDGRATAPDRKFRRLVLADVGDWWEADWRSSRCGCAWSGWPSVARAGSPRSPVGATTTPSGFELVDVMFETRCADERFRRLVLADLADWLPVDERTWRVAIRVWRRGG